MKIKNIENQIFLTELLTLRLLKLFNVEITFKKTF